MRETPDQSTGTVQMGATVYDEDGNALGTIQGVDDHGFHVASDATIEVIAEDHRSTGLAGKAELTWRCSECGTIGKISEMPEDGCEDCDAPQEAIYYHVQD